jgi:FMN-dependent NADH-azoreductase
MNKMELPEGMLYVGADIVDELIQSNKRKYPKHYFRVLDITQDELPKVDLMMVRDCLVHLSDADVKKALTNIKRS